MLNAWIIEIKATDSFNDRFFTDAVQEWLSRKRDDICENSFQCYQSYANIHILPYWSAQKAKLSEITVRDIQRYIDHEYNNGASAQSIKKYLVIINGVFNEAIRYGEVKYNPCDKAKLPKSIEYHGTAYTLDEAMRLVKGIEDEPIKPAIMLALYLGLRRSEILGLRWIDVDFEKSVVSIRNTVVRFNNTIEHEHTKSAASKRDLFLPGSLKEYLSSLRETQEQNRLLFGSEYHDSGHVCQRPVGTAFTPDYVFYHYKRIQKKLELPDIRLHDLRHTAGSLLINSGQTIKQVQAFLGHEKASTTLDVYSHIDTDGKRDTADAMDMLLSEQRC